MVAKSLVIQLSHDPHHLSNIEMIAFSNALGEVSKMAGSSIEIVAPPAATDSLLLSANELSMELTSISLTNLKVNNLNLMGFSAFRKLRRLELNSVQFDQNRIQLVIDNDRLNWITVTNLSGLTSIKVSPSIYFILILIKVSTTVTNTIVFAIEIVIVM